MDRALSQQVDLNNQSDELDSFGRLRVSEPLVLFESFFTFDSQETRWSQSLTGSATVTRAAASSTVNLNVTAASGDKAIRQSRRYVPYQAGRTQHIAISFVMSPAKTNLRQRVGLFDTDDGAFLELDGSTASFVARSSASGSPSDARKVTQANWNLDKLDGTGKSGVILDLTKLQLLIIDYGWQAAGSIRIGFLINGETIYAHQFHNANVLALPYFSRGSLPMRIEIENTGATSGASSLGTVCFVAMSESGFNPQGIVRSSSTGNTLKTIGTTFVPLISLRLKTSALKHSLALISHSISLKTNDNVEFAIVKNSTLTGAAFASVADESIAEADITASAATGGIFLHREFIFQAGNIATGFSSKSEVYNSLSTNIGSLLDGTSETISILARCFKGTADISSAWTWREFP